MSKSVLILGINGSPHKGHTRKLLKKALSEATKRGAQTRLIDLSDYKLSAHDGKLHAGKYQPAKDEKIIELHNLILKANGIIFASPTHWFNMSGLMKLFIDSLTSLEDYAFLLEGKVSGFITYGPEGGALNNGVMMAIVANQMGMIIPPYGIVFDEGRNEKWIIRDCKLLAKNIIEQIKAGSRIKWGYPEDKYKISPIELMKKKR